MDARLGQRAFTPLAALRGRNPDSLTPRREVAKRMGEAGQSQPCKTGHPRDVPTWVLVVFGCFLLSWVPAEASVPAWLQTAARVELPDYGEDVDAVLLHDEQITVVKDNGDRETVYRQAYKILSPAGQRHGVVTVDFDDETKLTYLKAWSLPTDGKEFEVKEKDAIETDMLSNILYSDVGHKVLRIPAADPGNVIGYEYRQKRRPSVLQDIWFFQDDHPVWMSRLELQLPPGWEFDAVTFNHDTIEPKTVGGNSWVWEMSQVPPLKIEPWMPPWRAVAGWMGVTYFPPNAGASQKERDWRRLGQWYQKLAAESLTADAAVRAKTHELVGHIDDPQERIAALASFVQSQIRYVAIEIGIGGYQPHEAASVLSNRYGDCKDKATLLKSMLAEIGVPAHYVLINSRRGMVVREFPSPLGFNHAILAIELPADRTESLVFGRWKRGDTELLYFDPTDELTPFGQLPAGLQGSVGLFVGPDGGELVEVPVLPPVSSRLLRVAKLTLDEDGSLKGRVQELRWGSLAAGQRYEFMQARDANDMTAVLERYLAGHLPGFRLVGGQVLGLRDFEKTLTIEYEFVANHYARRAGELLLLRPRVLGKKSFAVDGKEPRRHPLLLHSPSLETDEFEIILPQGYEIDEIPDPVQLSYSFGGYQSEISVSDGVLKYKRSYEIRKTWIGVEELAQFRKFMRKIAEDEKAAAVLKQIQR